MDLQIKAAEVAAELNSPEMPIGDSLYVVSVKRRDKYMQGGRVVLVPRKMAATLVVEATHEYASPEQIAEYVAEHRDRKAEVNRQIRDEAQKWQIVMTPEMVTAAASMTAKGKGKE